MGVVDVEWKLTQTFVNRVLRWGMEQEAERMTQIIKECRAYRYKRAKRLMLNEVFRNTGVKDGNN